MMNEMKNGVFTYKNEDYNFDFKTSLSAYEKLTFVKTVVGNLVDDNSYDFVVRDFIFDFAIIDIFTNIDTSFIDMKDEDGEDINPIILIEHFLEETNVVDIVKANMEIGLLDELNKAIDLNIQYITGINPNPLNEALANLVFTLEKKINEVDLDSMMSIVQKFNGMTEDFTLDNLVNAYMNSDTHKNNLAEIAEFKKRNSNAENTNKTTKSASKVNKSDNENNIAKK